MHFVCWILFVHISEDMILPSVSYFSSLINLCIYMYIYICVYMTKEKKAIASVADT